MAVTSKQFERLDIANWPNTYHIRYYKTMVTVLQGYFTEDNPAPVMLGPLLTEFYDKVTAEDGVIDLIVKMPQTEQIAAADSERDSLVKQYRDGVKYFKTCDFMPEKKAAALLLWPLIDHYNLDPYAELEKETEDIQQYYQDFSADQAQVAAAETLGFTSLIAQMVAKNTEVDTLMRQREEARSAQADVNVKATRAETDKAFADAVMMLDAYIVVDAHADRFDPLVNLMTQEQKSLKQIVDNYRRTNRRVKVESKAIGNHTYAVSSGWTWARLCDEPKVELAVAGNRVISTDKKAGSLVYFLTLKGLTVLPEAEVDVEKTYTLVLDGAQPQPEPSGGDDQGGGSSEGGEVTPVTPE